MNKASTRQFVRFDRNGNLVAANCDIFKGIAQNVSIFNQIPFFSSVKSTVLGLQANEKVTFPLVNLDFFGIRGYHDFSFTYTGHVFDCQIRKIKFSHILKNATYDRNITLIHQEKK